MTPAYSDPLVTLYEGDCLDVMRELPDASVDAVVTDPPYGLEFMGKEWDAIGTGRKGNPFDPTKRHMGEAKPTQRGNPWASERESYGAPKKMPKCGRCGKWRYNGSPSAQCSCSDPQWVTDTWTYPRQMQAWHEQWATEAFRVLKPGGHLLAFGGTRTYHRLASAIEDAGFEIRDTLMWIYASGFPKSLDVSKALDKVAGAERSEYVDPKWAERYPNGPKGNVDPSSIALPRIDGPKTTSDPVSDLARKWEGWGTALKPAHEPIVMARKPLVGTVAQNVTRYGTGALNIGATRIGTDGGHEGAGAGPRGDIYDQRPGSPDAGLNGVRAQPVAGLGRWPSNVLLSSPELFDEPNPGVVGSGATSVGFSTQRDLKDSPGAVHGIYNRGMGAFEAGVREGFNDSGGYSRFFIIPKADRAERERGLAGENGARANTHPTVKSLDLMRHLVRLVTPPGGTVLDPFLGSGTTALAASEEGFKCIGIEREPEYVQIAVGRLIATPMGLGLFEEPVA